MNFIFNNIYLKQYFTKLIKLIVNVVESIKNPIKIIVLIYSVLY